MFSSTPSLFQTGLDKTLKFSDKNKLQLKISNTEFRLFIYANIAGEVQLTYITLYLLQSSSLVLKQNWVKKDVPCMN